MDAYVRVPAEEAHKKILDRMPRALVQSIRRRAPPVLWPIGCIALDVADDLPGEWREPRTAEANDIC